MNVSPEDCGICTRHGCRLVVAPKKTVEAKLLFSTPKSSVLKIDQWVFHRFPFAGHNNAKRIDGIRREVYCPRCRSWWRVIRWLTLPYVMFR